MPRTKLPPEIKPGLEITRALTSDQIHKARANKVKMMASTETPLKAMAELLDMSVSDLKRLHAADIKRGHDYVYAVISLRLVNAAFAGDARSMHAWMRQYGNWTEVTRRELTGKDGAPISFRQLDDTSLTQIIASLAAQGVVGGRKGRVGAEIDLDAIDLDAISGPTTEGAE